MNDSRSKAARNEGVKLRATTLNTAGLTVFGLGVLTPLITGSMAPDDIPSVAVNALVAYMLHAIAQLILHGLED